MNYKILKHNDGRMLAVVWPDEFLYIVGDHLSAQYKTDCEQAIANGIEFKDLNDCEQIRKQLWKLETRNNDSRYFYATLDGWEMEKMKPYPLPEGLELEIRVEDWKGSPIVEQQCQFAFIKKPEPKEEIQEEIFTKYIDAFMLLKEGRSERYAIDKLKSQFRIERIKK